MMKRYTNTTLSATLTLSEGDDGFWIYDKTRGMNLAMRAKSEREAMVDCITYYQTRFNDMEKAYFSLYERVNDFVESFADTEVES